jgi:hypothetical protein
VFLLLLVYNIYNNSEAVMEMRSPETIGEGQRDRTNPVNAKPPGIDYEHTAGYYTHAPIAQINVEELTRSGADSTEIADHALSALYETYIDNLGPTQVARADELLERLQRDSPPTLSSPEAICWIPIAAKDESLRGLQALVKLLAAQSIAPTTEFVLYANYANTNDADTESAEERIDTLRAWTRSTFPDLAFRLISVAYEPEEITISQVRRDYMDMGMIEAQERGLPYNQPHIWLDADTYAMRPDCLESIANDIRHGSPDDVFSRARLWYTPNHPLLPRYGENGAEMPSAVRIALFHERARRRIQRDVRDKVGYIEEPGLGFSQGIYMALGGVRQEDPVNEGAHLSLCASINAASLLELNRAAHPGGPRKAKVVDTQEGVGFHILDYAWLGTSARRFLANAHIALGIHEKGVTPTYHALDYHIIDRFCDKNILRTVALYQELHDDDVVQKTAAHAIRSLLGLVKSDEAREAALVAINEIYERTLDQPFDDTAFRHPES